MSFKSKLLAGMGYFISDHRNSPGVSDELQATVPDATPASRGQVFEADIKTCPHCQRVIIFNPARTRPHDYCAKCDAYTCDIFPCNFECVPYLKYLDDLDKLDKQLVVI